MIEHKFPESRELDIELNDEIAEGEYSNLVIISHSTSEFVLDFVRMMPGVSKARIKAGSSWLRNTPNGCCCRCKRTSNATKRS